MVETVINYHVVVDLPQSMNNDGWGDWDELGSICSSSDWFLHLTIEQIEMKDISTGKDELKFSQPYPRIEQLAPTGQNASKGSKTLFLKREVIVEDVMKQTLRLMPGFRITWNYVYIYGDKGYQ